MKRAVFVFFIFSAVSVCPGVVITVDDDGPADFNNIQEAIDDANYGDTIYVAEGTYIENITLKNGVALTGQDPNNTIIDGNDSGSVVTSSNCDANTILEGFTITDGNSMDGGGMHNESSEPTITNCKFKNNTAGFRGGGMYNNVSNPTITNCTFIDNSAGQSGGGMQNRADSSPIITDCTFIDNSADISGGGMFNNSSGCPTVTNCTFSGNSAGIGLGGGICSSYEGNLIVTDCTFSENSAADSGGGIYNSSDSLTLINCTFVENAALYSGGGICCEECELEITDCTFSENSAFGGGGISTSDSNSTVTNCTFICNSATLAAEEWGHGGGMYNRAADNLAVKNCVFAGNSAIGKHSLGAGMLNESSNSTVTNCVFIGNSAVGEYSTGGGMYNTTSLVVNNSILWGNTANDGPQIYNSSGSLIITYSDIEGGWAGEGNIDADPCFAEAGYWDPNGTPEDANDDFWVNGDYHLQSQADRRDANNQSWVIDSNTSPCIDAGDWMSPVGHEPFPNGGRVNMGAYGGTVEASKSYFGEPPCETIIAGDINGDCMVNFIDFAIMALHWQQEGN